MQLYGNRSKNSGVIAYKLGKDYIIVAFSDATYLYDYISAGVKAIKTMKKLAQSGKGLSTYISRYVKHKYRNKL